MDKHDKVKQKRTKHEPHNPTHEIEQRSDKVAREAKGGLEGGDDAVEDAGEDFEEGGDEVLEAGDEGGHLVWFEFWFGLGWLMDFGILGLMVFLGMGFWDVEWGS